MKVTTGCFNWKRKSRRRNALRQWLFTAFVRRTIDMCVFVYLGIYYKTHIAAGGISLIEIVGEVIGLIMFLLLQWRAYFVFAKKYHTWFVLVAFLSSLVQSVILITHPTISSMLGKISSKMLWRSTTTVVEDYVNRSFRGRTRTQIQIWLKTHVAMGGITGAALAWTLDQMNLVTPVILAFMLVFTDTIYGIGELTNKRAFEKAK